MRTPAEQREKAFEDHYTRTRGPYRKGPITKEINQSVARSDFSAGYEAGAAVERARVIGEVEQITKRGREFCQSNTGPYNSGFKDATGFVFQRIQKLKESV